ncbi:MAG: peptidoglycan DD-metalloendopeptidase family protein [Actinobacteria bacterium]|nr:peptidoglycan DD-metalloendopeptidase family protein [Actinomycetota bacterium]
MRAVVLALVAAALLAVPGGAPGSAQERSADEVARELQEAEERRAREQGELGDVRAELTAARAELVAIQGRLAEARARLKVAEGQLALAEGALVSAEAAREAAGENLALAERLVSQAEQQLADEERALGRQVATVYKYGAMGRSAMYLTVIQQARTPNDVAVNLHQLGSVIDHQDGVVERVRELSRDRAELREAADATRVSAEQRQLDAAATLDVVTRLRADAEALTRQVADDEARQRAVLASLEASASEQSALLAAVERDVAALGDELEAARARRASAGGFTCPVTPSWFQNDWGFPRSGGRSHRGTDVFADRGTPVVAVADGTVVRVDHTDNYRSGTSRGDLGGRSVTIRTTAGEEWYFAHLDAVAGGLAAGTTVTAGQTLGTTGNSGNARTTPPHTHIEREVGGETVNPYPALDAACR